MAPSISFASAINFSSTCIVEMVRLWLALSVFFSFSESRAAGKRARQAACSAGRSPKAWECLSQQLALHEILARAHLDLVLQQLFQQLGGDVLVLQSAHLGEELIAENTAEERLLSETDNAERWAKPD